MSCRICGETPAPHFIPVWKEFTLFGVTWIVGRWKDIEPDVCDDCQADQQRERDRQIFDAGAEHASNNFTTKAER